MVKCVPLAKFCRVSAVQKRGYNSSVSSLCLYHRGDDGLPSVRLLSWRSRSKVAARRAMACSLRALTSGCSEHACSAREFTSATTWCLVISSKCARLSNTSPGCAEASCVMDTMAANAMKTAGGNIVMSLETLLKRGVVQLSCTQFESTANFQQGFEFFTRRTIYLCFVMSFHQSQRCSSSYVRENLRPGFYRRSHPSHLANVSLWLLCAAEAEITRSRNGALEGGMVCLIMPFFLMAGGHLG